MNRKRIGCLIALLMLGAGLRFWGLTHLGLGNWDEGVYALGGQWWSTLGKEGQLNSPAYAPPLYPVLIGIAFRIAGIHDWAAIAVSALFGTLSILAVYRLGTVLFDGLTGLLAAFLVAFSPYHVLFSRQALTDSTFLLFYVLALLYCWRIFTAAPGGAVVPAIAAITCAWWTKYHGLLPWLLTLPFALGEWLFHRRLPNAGRPLKQLSIVGFLSGILFLPWIFAVAGGYGLGRFWAHFQAYYTLFPGGLDRSLTVIRYLWHFGSPPAFLIGLCGLGALLSSRNRSALFLATHGGLFFLVSLLYQPYPRLYLPLSTILTVSGCALLARCIRGTSTSARVLAWVALLLTLWGETTLLPEILGRKQDGFRQVALFIRRDPSSLPAFATSLYPLSFYLPGGVLPLPSQFEPSKGTLVIDQFEKRYPAKTLADFIRESEYLTEIPSGLQDHTLLCNYSLSTLETKDNPPDAIRVYRLRRKR